jgi:hypothetical protein
MSQILWGINRRRNDYLKMCYWLLICTLECLDTWITNRMASIYSQLSYDGKAVDKQSREWTNWVSINQGMHLRSEWSFSFSLQGQSIATITDLEFWFLILRVSRDHNFFRQFSDDHGASTPLLIMKKLWVRRLPSQTLTWYFSCYSPNIMFRIHHIYHYFVLSVLH